MGIIIFSFLLVFVLIGIPYMWFHRKGSPCKIPFVILSPAYGTIREIKIVDFEGDLSQNAMGGIVNSQNATSLGRHQTQTSVESPGMIRISIFLSPFDIHRQYAPVDAEILDVQYFEGNFAPAFDMDESEYNEKSRIFMNTKYGPMIIEQLGGYVVRAIETTDKKRVKQGDEIGMIKLGSRVNIYFDKNIMLSPEIKVGKYVTACTPLA